MGFNYAKEKKKFDKEWKKLQKECEDAGMSPEAINAMHTYDWEAFLSRRTYSNHTQTLPECLSGNQEDDRSTLFHKYPLLSVSFDIDDFPGRYSWIATISDAHLTEKLALLSSEDLELLTFLMVYQTVSSIKVLDKERLAVRFKDGTEIEQEVINMRRASA